MKPSYNLEPAHTYLDVLTEGALCTLQTFSDRLAMKVKRGGKLIDPNARIYHGTLEQHAPRLIDLNRQHVGIYLMVNEGNGRGRDIGSVVRVRALFMDTDGAPLEPILKCSLEPQLIVESSPSRHHVYYLIDDLPLDEFGVVQKALAAHFKTDSSVSDLPRVMRLPSFYHCKREPFMVRLIEVNPCLPYSRADLFTGFPFIPEALERAAQESERAAKVPSDYSPPNDMAGRILKASERHIERVRQDGQGRHRTLMWAALSSLDNRLSEADAIALAGEVAHLLPTREGEPVDPKEAADVVSWVYLNCSPGSPWDLGHSKAFGSVPSDLNKTPSLSQKPHLGHLGTYRKQKPALGGKPCL